MSNVILPDVSQEIRDAVEKEIKVYPAKSNWASKLGHPCTRMLVHNRLDWNKKPKISVTSKMLFNGGDVLEQYIAKVYLEKAGYRIVEQERPVDWPEKEIGGRLDFVISREDLPDEIPVEVKSMEHYAWQKINTVEDFLFSKKSWHKTYPGQLTIYMLQKSKEFGMFLLVSKKTYEPKHIWVNLDYTYAEELVQKAEIINKHVKDKTYPDPIEYDPNLCRWCDFQTVCLCDQKNKGVNLADDPELEGKLERRAELAKSVEEYKELDSEIKQPYKDADEVKDDIIGVNWRIFTKEITSHKVDVKLLPKSVKDKYAMDSSYKRTFILDIRNEKK